MLSSFSIRGPESSPHEILESDVYPRPPAQARGHRAWSTDYRPRLAEYSADVLMTRITLKRWERKELLASCLAQKFSLHTFKAHDFSMRAVRHGFFFVNCSRQYHPQSRAPLYRFANEMLLILTHSRTSALIERE